MADPTLEERVAALEQEFAALEANKYQMSYSGQALEATLDYVNGLDLIADRKVASHYGSGNTYGVWTTINSRNYREEDTYFSLALVYYNGSSPYYVPATFQITTQSQTGNYVFLGTALSDIPSGASIYVSYVVIRKTGQ
jgi:hypothetical protein